MICAPLLRISLLNIFGEKNIGAATLVAPLYCPSSHGSDEWTANGMEPSPLERAACDRRDTCGSKHPPRESERSIQERSTQRQTG